MKPLTPFQKCMILSVLIVAFIAVMDMKGFQMWGTVGGYSGEVYGKASSDYMSFFWTFSYFTIAIVAITYYLLRKDWSETVALVAVPLILLAGGLEDIIYYFITGIQFFGTTMPWLYDNCWFMAFVAKMMGQTVVTSTSLLVSTGIAIFASYHAYTYLKKASW